MAEQNRKRLRILMVDDDPVTLALCQKILCSEENKNNKCPELEDLNKELFREDVAEVPLFSFDLVACTQGDEAVKAVETSIREEQPFSVAFLDVQMLPGPNEIGAAEQITAIDPYLEIVIVTADSDINPKNFAPRTLPVHKLLYIQKPFHAREIYQFASALSSKWLMERELTEYRNGLERLVEKRTVELSEANLRLEQEIAERKQREADLIKSKELFSKAFYTSPVPMTISTASDDTLLLANDAWLELLGFDRQEDVIGKSAVELGCWFDLTDREERNKRLSKTGSCWGQEIRISTPKGEIRSCLYSAEQIDHDGKACVLSMAIDFSDRIRAEKALRQSEEKYRELVENANSIILRWDIEGNITYLNTYGLNFFGYSLEELLGRNVVGTIVPETESTTKRDLISLMKDIQRDPDKYKNNENQNMQKDGTRVWISWTNRAVLDRDEKCVEILSIGNDITEKKNLEKRLQRVEKMEAIGTLAGGVAHDLNNVLAGVVSYPGLLLNTLPEDSPLRKPIITIQESGEKAAAIVHDLLTLSRRGVAVNEVVNLNSVISKYLKSPEYKKLESFHPDVELETDLQANLLNIMGSPIHLSKTIMNLVSNAAEAMHEGGKLSITTENQFVCRAISGYDDVKKGDYVVVKVSDTGTGISPDGTGRIFEPFYTKKKMGKSGTGLGMAVVWGTVKDHNGYIDVQSALEMGTTFTLYFPVTEQEPALDQLPLPAKDYVGRGESILVVDDVRGQRELAYTILSELIYSVTAVSSGEEAVAYLKENSVDLLILDMIMEPGMDGLDTYKEILKSHPGQKAIITSGFSETDRIKQAQTLGVGQYLQKPYSLEKIGMAVKSELNKRPAPVRTS